MRSKTERGDFHSSLTRVWRPDIKSAGHRRLLGAVVVMMLWLYISAYATVAGAELNAELERQTARDTTTGRPETMGRRDAYAADTLGDSPGR